MVSFSRLTTRKGNVDFYTEYDLAVSAAYAYGDKNPQLLSVAEAKVA